MVVHVPFVRWDKLVHVSDGSTRAGIYYLETARDERVFCAIAIPCEGNHMRYRPIDNFLQDYQAVLPSGHAVEWNFRFQLASWLDGIVYYSFLQCSEEGIGNCWHFTCVSPTGVAQRLPLGLRRYILPSGSATWILLVHGYRIWPVEIVDQRFGDGWDTFCAVHRLRPGFKVIFGCERRWIFHTVILDENDCEVRFHWSGLNVHQRQLHPPRALRTSCLPSSVSHEGTVLQFGHLHLPIVQMRLEFELRLKEAFREFDLEEMVIKMGDRVWNVPVNDLQLDVEVFSQFLDALDLGYLDFLLVFMLPNMEFRVVVFPMDYDFERIFPYVQPDINDSCLKQKKCRIKFNVTITDKTGSIDATIFPEIAEEIYNVTGNKIALARLGEPLAPEILHKLAEQKQGSITLKAYMYTYAGITQLRFNVYSMSPIADPEQINNPAANPALLPPTPTKRDNSATASPSRTSPEAPPAKKNKLQITEMS